MKKYYSILSVIILLIQITSCNHFGKKFQAPSEDKPGFLVLKSNACFFDNEIPAERKIRIELPGSQLNDINTILQFSGLPQNFKVYSGDVKTAMATIVNNQRILIYKPQFNTKTDSSYWAQLFIIAHEIGHHLAFNLSDGTNSVQSELDADKFAGSVLYRMGADSNQVLFAIQSVFFSDKDESKNQPSKEKRLEAIKKSWLKASELRYQAVVPPPVDDFLSITEFTDKNLIFNSYVRYMFQGELENQYDSVERLNMEKFLSAPVAKYIEGIIVGVEELPKDADQVQDDGTVFSISKVIKLKLDVLVTKVDSSSQIYYDEKQTIITNKKYEFEVWYEPLSGSDRIESFSRFFVIGRRFEFDLIDLDYHGMGGGLFNISRAKVIYKANSAYF